MNDPSHPAYLELPKAWDRVLANEVKKPYFATLTAFVQNAYATQDTLPPYDDIFEALRLCSPQDVRVVILGQDPYPTPGHAHGLCFSVNPHVALPRSLVNIYTELSSDLDQPFPTTGNLNHWARQGVLMLNTILTVQAHAPLSHKDRGWEKLTDAIIQWMSVNVPHCVFIFWGRPAQKKAVLIDASCHLILQATHPSPLSAHRGFFNSRPFSTTNTYLVAHGSLPIAW